MAKITVDRIIRELRRSAKYAPDRKAINEPNDEAFGYVWARALPLYPNSLDDMGLKLLCGRCFWVAAPVALLGLLGVTDD